MQASNIDEVVAILDEIVAVSERESSRLGYFAALYRTVTIIVRQRCDEGFFADNERMRQLDTIFANRYFAAYFAEQNQTGSPTRSWRAAVSMANKRQLMILQQLLLGMNAHISLDLGIATAEVAAGELTRDLQADFNRLNIILASLVDTVQGQISTVSPFFRFADALAGRLDERIVDLSMSRVRDRAWAFAQHLTPLQAEDRVHAINEQDQSVALASRLLSSTNWYFVPLVWLIALSEPNDVRRVITTLSDDAWRATAQQRVTVLAAQAALD